MEEKALSEVEFWKLASIICVFLLQAVTAWFGKDYFKKLEIKMNRVEDKIDKLEDSHNATAHTLGLHEYRIKQLEQA